MKKERNEKEKNWATERTKPNGREREKKIDEVFELSLTSATFTMYNNV